MCGTSLSIWHGLVCTPSGGFLVRDTRTTRNGNFCPEPLSVIAGVPFLPPVSCQLARPGLLGLDLNRRACLQPEILPATEGRGKAYEVHHPPGEGR